MTLRKSESVLRLLVGLALGYGFLGFATHGSSSNVDDQTVAVTAQHASL